MSSTSGGDLGSPPGRLVSLLDPGEPPAERRGPPEIPSSSSHSPHRELEAPKGDFDQRRAQLVCSQICRQLLLHLAPALVFLSRQDRLRLQVLTAYVRTLFDFTSDRSLEGERLSQINRWQFALEESLAGEPAGQPIFVALAALNRQQPWDREALDCLASLARARISSSPATSSAGVDVRSKALVESLLRALDEPVFEKTVTIGVTLVRAHSLCGRVGDLGFRRADLDPDRSTNAVADDGQNLIRAEILELLQRLRENGADPKMRRSHRRALAFAKLSTVHSLEQALRQRPIEMVSGPGALKRARLLLQARFAG